MQQQPQHAQLAQFSQLDRAPARARQPRPGHALATFTDPGGNWESLVTGDDGTHEFTITLLDLRAGEPFAECVTGDYAEAVRIARELVQ